MSRWFKAKAKSRRAMDEVNGQGAFMKKVKNCDIPKKMMRWIEIRKSEKITDERAHLAQELHTWC